MDKEKKRMIRGLPFAFIIGIGLIIAGIITIIENENFGKYASETEATITRIEVSSDGDGGTNHTAFVIFFVNGTEYRGKLDTYTSKMKEGSNVRIRYDPNNPKKFRYCGFSYGGLLMILLGGVLLTFGFLQIKNRINIEKQGYRLQ